MGALGPSMAVPVRSSRVKADAAIWSGFEGFTVTDGSESWLTSALREGGTMLTRVICAWAVPVRRSSARAVRGSRGERMGVASLEKMWSEGPKGPKGPKGRKLGSGGVLSVL